MEFSESLVGFGPSLFCLLPILSRPNETLFAVGNSVSNGEKQIPTMLTSALKQ
jgi:hypothetical protein